jgi:hypothetical protein
VGFSLRLRTLAGAEDRTRDCAGGYVNVRRGVHQEKGMYVDVRFFFDMPAFSKWNAC